MLFFRRTENAQRVPERRAVGNEDCEEASQHSASRCKSTLTRQKTKMPELIGQLSAPARAFPPPFVARTLDRDQLIERHLPYARALAVEIMSELNSPSQIELNDLIGYGELGLVEAAERFDAGRGVAFTTFAYYRIRGAVYDGLRRMGWLSRGEYRRARFAAAANHLRQNALDDEGAWPSAGLNEDIAAVRQIIDALIPVYLLSLDSTEDLPELIDHSTPHSALLEEQELKALTRHTLAELSADDQFLLEEIYYQNASMVEVAAKIGASKSWVSRLHARAVVRLRQAMAKQGLLAAQ